MAHKATAALHASVASDSLCDGKRAGRPLEKGWARCIGASEQVSRLTRLPSGLEGMHEMKNFVACLYLSLMKKVGF